MTPELVLYLKFGILGAVLGLILGFFGYSIKRIIDKHLITKRIKQQAGKVKFRVDGKEVDMVSLIPVKKKKVKKEKKKKENPNLVKDFVEVQNESI